MIRRVACNPHATDWCCPHLCGQGKQLLDVALLVAAVLGEELKAVAVVGQVRGRDHHGAVVLVPCAGRGPMAPHTERSQEQPFAFFMCREMPSTPCELHP